MRLNIALRFALGLGLGCLFSSLAGESPIHVARVLFMGSLGSWQGLGLTLFYSIPVALTGLAVLLPLRTGLFNIGAEGQLLWGALVCAGLGAALPPGLFFGVIAGLAGACAGFGWAWIVGALLVKRGVHEVIGSILLNFVAAGLTTWLAMGVLRDPTSQNPETTPLSETMRWALVGPLQDTGLHVGIFLAWGLCIACHFFISKTRLGFEMRMAGGNPRAATLAGIAVNQVRTLAICFGGFAGGLCGVAEVLGVSGRFKLGFSNGFGFTGIAVALVAGGKPLAIIPASILFGALQQGASELALESDKISREVVMVLQALVVLFVTAPSLNFWRRTS